MKKLWVKGVLLVIIVVSLLVISLPVSLQLLIFGWPIVLSLILVRFLYGHMKTISPEMSNSILVGMYIGIAGSVLLMFFVEPICDFFVGILRALFGWGTCHDYACLMEGTILLAISIVLGALIGIKIGYLIHERKEGNY